MALTVVLAWVFLSQGLRIFVHEIRRPPRPFDRHWRLVEARDNSHICNCYNLGLALKKRAGLCDTIALVPAGAVAYASGLTVVDMLGLNDREIAHQKVNDMGRGLAGHEKGRGDLVLRRNPMYILLHHQPELLGSGVHPPDDEDLGFVPVRELWRSADFHRLYEPILMPIDDKRGYTVYRRKG